MRPVCRNIQNDQLYFFEGGKTFRNIRTGQAGDVEEEKARDVFRFNMQATELINEYPIVEEMIKTLNLKIDNLKNDTK